jgi:hypothetical protein
MATAAMIARTIPPHFNVGTSQVGMISPLPVLWSFHERLVLARGIDPGLCHSEAE